MGVPKITAGTWARLIILTIALINSVLAIFGIKPLPIDEDQVNSLIDMIYQVISAVLVIAAALAAWWKNNDITKQARMKKEVADKEIKKKK